MLFKGQIYIKNRMKLKREIGKPRAVFAELNTPFSVIDSIEKSKQKSEC